MAAKAHLELAKKFGKPPMKYLFNDVLMEIVELLFTEEEAIIAKQLSLFQMDTSDKIAKKVKRPKEEISRVLEDMSQKGLILAFGEGADRKFAFLPLVPGIYEAIMSKAPQDVKAIRFAELFEEYFVKETFCHAMKRPLTSVKVIPIEQSVANTIGALPNEKFREAIDHYDIFGLAYSCSCRHHKELIGQACDRPKDVCMSFGKVAEYAAKAGFARLVSREEMWDAISRAEESGLIHITDNVARPSFSCNCCGCCCGFLASLNRFNVPGVLSESRFMVEVDEELCKACGKCAKVCPVGALHVYNKKLIYEPWRCIGCGVCIGACKKNHALKLVSRQEHAGIPENYGQLVTNMTFQYLGLNRFIEVLPGFTRLLGNGVQAYFNRLG